MIKKSIIKVITIFVLGCTLLAASSALAAEQSFGQVTANGVNMRAQANKESASLGELTLGTTVEVLADEDSWFRVMYNGTVGYVRSEYLFVNEGGSRGAYVLDDGSVLRGGPDQSSYVVEKLSAGQGVKVKSIIGEWYFVVANDQVGYVHRTQLTMTKASTAAGSMLKQGMEGAEVKKLQNSLCNRGFISRTNVSGNFDSKTRAAVVEYQQACGLSSADGIAGPETLQSIYDSSNRLKKETATFTQLKGTVILLDWFKGGSDWLAKGTRFTITDVRTGLSFRARRFGGWYHADSEPITAYDTKIMKRCAGGKWSWDRRPIWVTYNGKTVAASMHCMPHMANPTRSNNFDGHFCIHLKGSLVHETSRACPRHQACVMEAYKAGR
ncbi:MAG: SH3 domain-containing protein [Clostridia bacterium]